SMMEFAGNRDQDIDVMVDAFKARSIQNVRNAYITSLETASEHDVISDAQLEDALHSIGLSDEAIGLIQLAVKMRKLRRLDELYRQSVSLAYGYGEITDADYIPHLEAIGIGAGEANARYAIDSIKKRGRAALQEAKDAARVESTLQRETLRNAHIQFLTGQINEEQLAAELL